MIHYLFSMNLMFRLLPAATTLMLFCCAVTLAYVAPAQSNNNEQQPGNAPPPTAAVNPVSSSEPKEGLSPITIVESSPLIIDPPADTQTGIITIRNNTPASVPVLLQFGNFINNTTETLIPAEVSYSWPDGSAKNFGEFVMQSGVSIKVRITVSQIQGEGEGRIPLINSITGAQIGQLRLIRTPFDVSLDVPLVVGENTQKLNFKRGTPTSFVLKNGSSTPYKVRWMMAVNGVKYCGQDAPSYNLLSWGWIKSFFLPQERPRCTPEKWKEEWKSENISPNSKKIIEIVPPDGWFPRAFQSIFKDDVQVSSLRLRLEEYAGGETSGTLSELAKESLPEKEIPFTAHLAFYSPNTQLILSTIVISVVLLVGGVFSLIVRNWVPNQLRKQDLKEKLAKLSVKTSALSSRLDSNLRVLVRVEPKRLTDLLNSRIIISPDMATVFTLCEKGIKSLERRVSILETVDSTYERLDALWSSWPPPSLIGNVELQLSKASQLLRSTDPSEFDFEAAKTSVAGAILSCERIHADDDKFAEYLNGRITSLKSSLAPQGPIGSTQTCERIRKLLPGLFKILEDEQDPKHPTPIASDDYSRLDMSALALTMIRDYVQLYENSSNLQKDLRLVEYEDKFIKHLSLQSREQLAKAQSLLRQMREGIFTSDIEEAIRNREIAIEMDPPVAREQHPVRFSARFNRIDLNDSAARESFECIWDFGNAHVHIDKGRFWSRSKPKGAVDGALVLAASNSMKDDKTHAGDPNRGVESGSSNNQPVESEDRFIERGWSVCHYFVLNTTHHVTVWFEDQTGKTICENNSKLELKRPVLPAIDPSAQSKDRLKTEMVSLAIVLVVALLGLITGAREQVLKLDIVPGLVTVFLLGFSADAIKNLLTQRSP
jgi:hypothetical protein